MTDPTLDSIRRHSDTALGIARGYLRKLPRNILREDIEQAALIGLFEWKRSHPDEENPGWIGGLRVRIRGSIIDELRRQAPFSRYAHRAERIHMDGLDDALPGWADRIASDSPDPCERIDAQRIVADALCARLGERCAKVIDLHYYRGKKLREIGADLGVSEPRVSQLHSRAIEKMRDHLERETNDHHRRSHRRVEGSERADRHSRQVEPRAVLPTRLGEAPAPAVDRRGGGATPGDRVAEGELYGGRCAAGGGGGRETVTSTLPEEGVDLRAELQRYQDWMVEQALIRTNGNRAQAAKLLGLKRTALVMMLRESSPLRPERSVPQQREPAPAPAGSRIVDGTERVARATIAALKAEGLNPRQAANRLGVNRFLIEREYRRLAPLAKCGPKEPSP